MMNCVVIHADGRFLAIGCQDSNVYVYESLDDCHVFRRSKNGVLKVCMCLYRCYECYYHMSLAKSSLLLSLHALQVQPSTFI